MTLFEGSASLLLEDISLLKKQLYQKGENFEEKEVLYTLTSKLALFNGMSGAYRLTFDPCCQQQLQSYVKNDQDEHVSDFISKKGNYQCFVQSILPILEKKYSSIVSFSKSHTLLKKDMFDIMKDYISKEHPDYYEFFISFLKKRTFRE